MRYLNQFSDRVRSLISVINTDSKLSSIALGKFLADRLVVPASPVEDVEEFYHSNCKTIQYESMSIVIESAVIDTDTTEHYKRMFWLMKYKMLHSPTNLVSTGSGALDFLGLSMTVPKDDLLTLEQSSAKLMLMYSGFKLWYLEIDKMIESRKDK